MERHTLLRRAKSLMAIVNGTEKHECFHIDALVPDDRDNIIIVAPKNKYDNTLWNYEKILAWAELNDFSAIMTVTPENQPSFRLVHADYQSQR